MPTTVTSFKSQLSMRPIVERRPDMVLTEAKFDAMRYCVRSLFLGLNLGPRFSKTCGERLNPPPKVRNGALRSYRANDFLGALDVGLCDGGSHEQPGRRYCMNNIAATRAVDKTPQPMT